MQSDKNNSTLSSLIEAKERPVWSLLVSVFGDLARQDGDAIDGPVLSRIMDALDVRPEASRVALHRLRNDGWIRSKKIGRVSRHKLTPQARAETQRASLRIYAPPTVSVTGWKVVVSQNPNGWREGSHTEDFVEILPHMRIGSGASPPPLDAFVLYPETIPDWVRTQVGARLLGPEYAELYENLRKIETRLPDSCVLTPLQTAVLRCLLVHDWRRLILKHPDVPPEVCPDDWHGHQCRGLVHRLLTRFPAPDLSEV
jgi:phenylacetic acid degradation operon negative regulatory protein